ncbi:MAG: hypothetical protein Q7K43_05910, partial [Candidatus Woesearchaeota archaeon]|nr:hypothetical protein [Candidatus Woesearchaeota archaeon]
LSAVLHKHNFVEEGFQLNHSWFKSEKVLNRLPQFKNKEIVVNKMIALEILCEKLAYGAPKPVEIAEKALSLFTESEVMLMELLK